MAWLDEFWRGMAALLRRNQTSADLDEEMRLHLELRAQRSPRRAQPPKKPATSPSGASAILCS